MSKPTRRCAILFNTPGLLLLLQQQTGLLLLHYVVDAADRLALVTELKINAHCVGRKKDVTAVDDSEAEAESGVR